MSDTRFTLAGRLKAFTYALRGIKFLWQGEPTTRFHLAGTVLALGGAWYFDFATWEWAFVIAFIGLVWFAEGVNSAVERACDAITLERDPLIGRAKDLAAGAVLIISMTALAVALLLYGPRVVALLGG
ncbi:diacylglycerol kinase [Sphingomicrobium clamense]|uniref:Diacylglycerol kinase family protein n=1 Tax=Sphingomicrobium clamense TaxID=2851013 RepID=A0ABS6V727_9SPHN|nr:diacylglycerol kinase family protein [Sphingomicrobium sp. B8]MBW0145371.1 diacylglycerol kinase family protein [Sphingomicrobium sp. B8]